MAKPQRTALQELALKQTRGKKKRREKGSGTKKYERNRLKCQIYKREGRREINKARKQARIVKRLARRAAKRASGGGVSPSRSRT